MKRVLVFLIAMVGVSLFANAEVLTTPNPNTPNNMTMPNSGQQSGTITPEGIKPQPGTNPPQNSGTINKGQTNPESNGTLNNNPGTTNQTGTTPQY